MSMTSQYNRGLRLFFVYAGEDEAWRKSLESHLQILKQLDIIKNWGSNELGTLIADKSDTQMNYLLNTSDIILLLLSSNFFAYGPHIKPLFENLLDRQGNAGFTVIPVLISPVAWQQTPINSLKFLPSNHLPVQQWKNKDEAFVDIVRGIRDVARKITDTKTHVALTPIDAKKDFLISYDQHDTFWANWICNQLQEAGYTCTLQEEASLIFSYKSLSQISEMAERVLFIISPAALQSDFAQVWAKSLLEDPTGRQGIFLPIQVKSCDMPYLLEKRPYIDITDLEENQARKLLLDGIRNNRVKTTTAPHLPETRLQTTVLSTKGEFALNNRALVRLVIVYSHRDEKVRSRLESHLKPLKRQGLLNDWRDYIVEAEADSTEETAPHFLKTASIILFLLSADLLVALYSYKNTALQSLLRQSSSQSPHIMPVLCRPCALTGTPFEKFKLFPISNRDLVSAYNLDEALLEIVVEIRRVISEGEQERLSAISVSSFAPARRKNALVSLIWKVPYERNPFFTGREELLSHLHATLTQNTANKTLRPYALSGLGGIGKTQLALEFSYRYQPQEYNFVFWVRAESAELLILDFQTIAHDLKIVPKDVSNHVTLRKSIHNWLGNNTHWLLIFDNADDLSLVKEYLPTNFHGHILLTTRKGETEPIAQSVPISNMTMNEGALFLLRRLQYLPPHGVLREADATDLQSARDLSQLLDGLPLALALAAAYVENRRCSLMQYLEFYEHQRDALLNTSLLQEERQPTAIVTAFVNSFSTMMQNDFVVAELLTFCAFLDPDNIPEMLLLKCAPELGTLLAAKLTSQFVLDTYINTLRQYSLVNHDKGQKKLSISRIVQDVIRYNLGASKQQIWIERTVRALNRAFPRVELATWQICHDFLAQAQIGTKFIKEKNLTFLEAGHLLRRVGDYLQICARYNEANVLLEQAQDIYTQQQTPDKVGLAQTQAILAGIAFTQGNFSHANMLYDQALCNWKNLFASLDHEDTAKRAFVLNNMARIFQAQERGTEAEEKYLEAHQLLKGISEKGAEADTLSNLSVLYLEQGKYPQAKNYYEQALSLWSETQEINYIDLAKNLDNLADLYVDQRKYSAANRLYLQVQALQEQTLAPDDTRIADSLTKLAAFYHTQGRYAQAEPCLQRALEIHEQQQGVVHPEMAHILNSLATLQSAQGLYTPAEELFKRAITINEETFGHEHPQTAATLNNLATLYRDLGRYEQAEKVYKEALRIYETTIGRDSPQLSQIFDELATLYSEQGEYKKALSYIERAIDILQEGSGSGILQKRSALKRKYSSVHSRLHL